MGTAGACPLETQYEGAHGEREPGSADHHYTPQAFSLSLGGDSSCLPAGNPGLFPHSCFQVTARGLHDTQGAGTTLKVASLSGSVSIYRVGLRLSRG